MYPITYEADFNPTPSRGTTFFRLLLAIPWFVVAIFWMILSYLTHFIAWVAIVILGRYPEWLFNFNSGVVRFGVRLSAWINLQTDEWPPFGLSDDDSYPIRVKFGTPAARQSRVKAFFRLILVFPVLFVYAYGTAAIAGAAALVAWLTIVFRGYMPSAVNDILTYCHSFQARVLGYFVFLTDEYPPIGLEKAQGGATGGVVQPPAPAAPAV